MTECLGSVAILLLLALTFETGLVAEGLWATADGTTLFLAQTAMTIVLLATVPGALYLFRLRSVRDRLIADGETAPAALGQRAHAHDLRTDGPRPAALLPLPG